MLTKSFLLLPPHTSVLPLIVCLSVYVEKETERNNLQETSGPCVEDSVCWAVLPLVPCLPLYSPPFRLGSLKTLCLSQTSVVSLHHTLCLPSNP